MKDWDCNSVDIIYPPQIEITKTADKSVAWANPIYGPDMNSNLITYTITVRNVGPYPITCVHVVDEMLGLDTWICCLMPCCDDCPDNVAKTIVDGESGCGCPSCEVGCMNEWTFTKTIEVPCDWSWCDDGDYLNNEASVSGWACGHSVSDSDTESVLIKDPYHLEIVKTAPEVVYQGQNIVYSIMVRNAGSMVLSYIDVYDDVDKDGIIDWKATIECLAPCQVEYLSWTYQVPLECCKKDYKLCNYVYANAWVRDVKVEAHDYASSWVMCPCSLDIVVEAQDGAVPGETVEFTATVTNDGNITIVQMDVFAMVKACECHDWEPYKLGCIIYLNPGESKEFTFNYTIPTCEQCCQAGFWLKYSALVEGECGCSEKEIWAGDCGYLWVRACCAIDVEKTANIECAEPGETIIYTITVTNLGVKPLCGVTVWDDKLMWSQEDRRPYARTVHELGRIIHRA